MQLERRVTEAVEKIEAGNGLESKPWRDGSRKCPDLDGGIATAPPTNTPKKGDVGNALIWTEGLRLS